VTKFYDLWVVLGAFGLFYLGWKQFVSQLQILTSPLAQRLLKQITLSKASLGLWGILLGALLASGPSTSAMFIGFIHSGLMPVVQGIALSSGALFGESLLSLILGIRFHDISCLGLIAVGVFGSTFISPLYLKNLFKMFAGLGVAFFAINLFSNSAKILLFSGASYEEYLVTAILFFVAFVLGFLGKTVVWSLVMALVLVSTGVATPYQGLLILVGANMGVSTLLFVVSRKCHIKGRYISRLETLVRFALLFGLIFALYPLTDLLVSFGTGTNTLIFAVHIGYQAAAFALTLGLYSLLEKRWNRRFEEIKEKHKVQLLDPGGLLIPSLAAQQVLEEQKRLAAMVQQMMEITNEGLIDRNNREVHLQKIEKYERITDNLEREIRDYINHIAQKQLTPKQSEKLGMAKRFSFEMESIADNCLTIVKSVSSIKDCESPASQEILNNFSAILKDLTELYEYYFQSAITEADPKSEEFLRRRGAIDSIIQRTHESFHKTFKSEPMDSDQLFLFTNMFISTLRIRDRIVRLF
jgi:phosphate:Na+ symporter